MSSVTLENVFANVPAQTDITSTDQILIKTSGGTIKNTTPAKIFTDISTAQTTATNAAVAAAGTPPVGVILPYTGLTAPTGYLLCDGTSVSRTTYAALFAVLTALKGTVTITIATPGVLTFTGHGLITGDVVSISTTGALPTGLTANENYYVVYATTDTFSLATSYANAIAGTKIATSGSQSGTHTLLHNPYKVAGSGNFYLPDARGAFLRSAGTSVNYTQNNTIPLGSYLDDQMQGHVHTIAPTGTTDGTGAIDTATTAGGTIAGQNPSTDGTNGTPRTGNETRPKSVAVNYIIKY